MQRKVHKSSEHKDIWPIYKLGQQNYDYSRQESTVDNEELLMEDEQWERGGIRTEQGGKAGSCTEVWTKKGW